MTRTCLFAVSQLKPRRYLRMSRKSFFKSSAPSGTAKFFALEVLSPRLVRRWLSVAGLRWHPDPGQRLDDRKMAPLHGKAKTRMHCNYYLTIYKGFFKNLFILVMPIWDYSRRTLKCSSKKSPTLSGRWKSKWFMPSWPKALFLIMNGMGIAEGCPGRCWKRTRRWTNFPVLSSQPRLGCISLCNNCIGTVLFQCLHSFHDVTR